MTLLILQNIDIQKIDTSLLDLSSLTTEQIQQYLGQFVSQDVNQGIQVDDSNFKKFKNKASLAAFFGDVPSNVRGRLKNNIEIMAKCCPMDGNSKRENMKTLIHSIQKDIPNVKTNIYGAIKRSNIKGWKE